MRLSVFWRRGRLTLLGASLLAGCQQSSAPLQLGVIGDESMTASAAERGGQGKEVPYENRYFQDEDASSDLLSTVMSTTRSAMDHLVAPMESSMKWLSGDRPSQAVLLLEDGSSPDNRREGMNKLADFGFLRTPSFVKRCRQIAQFDGDFTVRATAIRISNRARDSRATSLFITGLTDGNEWVRLESAKALANVPDVNAAAPLLAMLNSAEESRDVRVAAADALKHYRTLPVVRALCVALHDKTFVVAWQARRSLRYLTSRDYGYDEGAWLGYFTGPEKPLG